MKIVEVRIDESVLPKKDKDWKFALAASSVTQGWIVCIRAEDGTVGYGYAYSEVRFERDCHGCRIANCHDNDGRSGRNSRTVYVERLWGWCLCSLGG